MYEILEDMVNKAVSNDYYFDYNIIKDNYNHTINTYTRGNLISARFKEIIETAVLFAICG